MVAQMYCMAEAAVSTSVPRQARFFDTPRFNQAFKQTAK